MYKKTTTTVEEYFDTPAAPVQAASPFVQSTPMRMASSPLKSERPVIRVDVPLMIRLLEYAREETMDDIVLHKMVERMIDLCQYGEVLDMDEYYDIIDKERIFQNGVFTPNSGEPT